MVGRKSAGAGASSGSRASGPLIGAHMSIAGGVSKALARGREAGCATIQIFTKNANQWAARPLDPEEVVRFKAACRDTGIKPVVAHDSYLINLASPDPALYKKSIDALRDELERTEALGLVGLIIHPGAHMGAGEKKGLARIARALDRIHARTAGFKARILLENTSGQGTVLGHRFEHLATIMEQVKAPERLGVCFDTCHAFAAGYDISTEKGYCAVFREFGRIIGIKNLRAMHLNDSRGELGSRRDRHAQIGKGAIGLEGFRCIMIDRRLARIPKILETPKGEDLAEDRLNLATLRRLAEMK
jgi:deoxyribonuclease-4